MRQLLRTLRTTLVLRALELLGPRRRRIVGWRALVGAGVRDVTFVRDGLVWTVSPEDGPVGFGLFTDGAYHGDEVRALVAWMARSGVLAPPRDVIVDAGAHVGSSCIPLVRATGGRALAIEPVAESFRRLETNVVANGLADRITRVRAAVTREAGRVTMCAETAQSGSCFVRREQGDALGREPDGGTAREEVRGLPLDALLAEAGVRPEEVAIVWADAQGGGGRHRVRRSPLELVVVRSSAGKQDTSASRLPDLRRARPASTRPETRSTWASRSTRPGTISKSRTSCRST